MYIGSSSCHKRMYSGLESHAIRESIDSLCRDGADTPIVRVHTKALETLKRSRSKPFRAPSYPIPAFKKTFSKNV